VARTRHTVNNLASLVLDEPSPAIICSSFTRGIFDRFGSGSVIDFEASPDGGVSWHKLFDIRRNQILKTVPAPQPASYMIPMLAKTMRVTSSANISQFNFDGLREIA
jgi:hypothetical protein